MEPFLDGVRVLDLTRLLPGPYATTLLADLGAEVIKVEEPEYGDPVRHREPTVDGRSFTFLVRNRNKASVGLNLKDERGRQAFLDLAETADVIVESFRPGVCDRLGIGYEDVGEVNEDIVYCSLTGYGQTGPYADKPGHDLNYIGVSGLLELTGRREGHPQIPGYPIGDFAGGLFAAFAIAAGLAGVNAGKSGEYIDVSMTDAVTSFATVYADRYFGEGIVPKREKTRLLGYHPGYQVYQTSDEKYVTVAALEKRFWNNLCEALDLPELKEHHITRYEDIPEKEREGYIDSISAKIADRSQEEWLRIFEEYDVPGAPVNDYESLFEDPHLVERDLFDTIEINSDTNESARVRQISLPLQFDRDRLVDKEPASPLGRDTERLLREVGYDTVTISALAEEDVITLGQNY